MQNFNPSLEQIVDKINEWVGQGQMQSAWQLSLQLTNNFPRSSEAWVTRAMLAVRIGFHEEAITAINRATKIKPDDYKYKLHKIMMLEAAGEIKQALILAKKINNPQFKDTIGLQVLAEFFNKHQQYEQSSMAYQNAINRAPENSDLLLNLAMTKQYMGLLDESSALCNEALQYQPDNCNVHFFRSHLKKQTLDNNNIEELLRILRKPIGDPVQNAKGLFALAKEYEDCENYKESFKARKEGAEIYRSVLSYDLRSDLEFMEALRSSYTKELIAQKQTIENLGSGNREPIFVTGLPRTGTTLLERIITSHSDVSAAGELTHFNRHMINELSELKLSPQLPRSKMVAASVDINFTRLGENYIQAGRPLTGTKAHFVDKFPQNALYIGLIHLALPKAKILILERHPLDVCYSVYKQMFTEIYQFSYNLDELAEYYIEHQKLIEHWKTVIPNAVKVIRYENLVHDLETQAKDVISFCSLSWQERCLSFHKNKQATTTASASQVRQKLYSSSIGMWKNYKEELKPLIKKLAASGCLDGWEY